MTTSSELLSLLEFEVLRKAQYHGVESITDENERKVLINTIIERDNAITSAEIFEFENGNDKPLLEKINVYLHGLQTDNKAAELHGALTGDKDE